MTTITSIHSRRFTTQCHILGVYSTGFDPAARRRWAPLGIAGRRWAPLAAPLGAAGHICAYFATCSWKPLTMLNPHFVAGEHGLFGGHKSEDIRTFFIL